MQQRKLSVNYFVLQCGEITLKNIYGHIMAQERKIYICNELLDVIVLKNNLPHELSFHRIMKQSIGMKVS